MKQRRNIRSEGVELLNQGTGEEGLPDLLQNVSRKKGEAIESSVKAAFERNRELFAQDIVNRLRDLAPVSAGIDQGQDLSADWIGIESMSRLRSVVGGRFQNLKERWTQAGLPLREHRGDKGQTFELDQRGWIELSNWISQQGYDVRLARGESGSIFEIRKREE